jgi:hypothetical protein
MNMDNQHGDDGTDRREFEEKGHSVKHGANALKDVAGGPAGSGNKNASIVEKGTVQSIPMLYIQVPMELGSEDGVVE